MSSPTPLVTPHSHFPFQLSYISNYFPQLSHLTLTSESLPDEPENHYILDDRDLSDLVNFCKNSPSLELVTFKGIKRYSPSDGQRWEPRTDFTWEDMECEVAAMGVVIESVKRDGYQEEVSSQPSPLSTC